MVLPGWPSPAPAEGKEIAKQAKSARHAMVPNDEAFRVRNSMVIPISRSF